MRIISIRNSFRIIRSSSSIWEKTSNPLKGILQLAGAILILAISVRILSKVDFTSAIQGTILVGALLAELWGFMKLIGKGGQLTKIGASLLLTAVAVRVLVKAVEKLGKIDPEVVARGLTAVFILLAELGTFAKVLSGSKGLIGVGISMIAVAVAIAILR